MGDAPDPDPAPEDEPVDTGEDEAAEEGEPEDVEPVETPDSGQTDEPKTITEDFEDEFEVSAEAAGEFLVELGEQLARSGEIVVAGDDWQIPFRFEEPVELEVEFEGGDEPELEIEIELTGRSEHDVTDEH